MSNEGHGQIFGAQVLGVGLPTPLSAGSGSTVRPRWGTEQAFLNAAAGKEEGHLSLLLQVERVEERTSFSHPHVSQHGRQGGGQASSPTLLPSVLAHVSPTNRISPTVMPRWGWRAVFALTFGVISKCPCLEKYQELFPGPVRWLNVKTTATTSDGMSLIPRDHIKKKQNQSLLQIAPYLPCSHDKTHVLAYAHKYIHTNTH